LYPKPDSELKMLNRKVLTRTHVCRCGCVMDRDENAARNILSRGLGTVGHTGTFALDASKQRLGR
ncbi:zinc ribbon domain-containing protein, partial [Nostoc sp. UHCC 0251]|uniref:zinc ribbon domain-containing protein n=1 Tax=Nostoc sp. UHCC 0251 TaxID=3110240 RepID=UPI003A4DAB1B